MGMTVSRELLPEITEQKFRARWESLGEAAGTQDFLEDNLGPRASS